MQLSSHLRPLIEKLPRHGLSHSNCTKLHKFKAIPQHHQWLPALRIKDQPLRERIKLDQGWHWQNSRRLMELLWYTRVNDCTQFCNRWILFIAHQCVKIWQRTRVMKNSGPLYIAKKKMKGLKPRILMKMGCIIHEPRSLASGVFMDLNALISSRISLKLTVPSPSVSTYVKRPSA